MKESIEKALKKIIKSDFRLEVPPDPKLGDFSLPCFTLAKEFKKSPKDVAEYIRSKLNLTIKMEVVNGYLNFFVNSKDVLKKTLINILKTKEKFGSSNIGKKKKIVLDYSSPNVAKPFGIGHLRSSVIGNSLYKIFSFMGFKCVGVNHLGDWGTQFGKLIIAYHLWGDPKKVKNQSIAHLYGLYVKFHQEAEINPKLDDEAREWFKKLEQGDKEAYKLWSWFRELSLKEFKKYYRELEMEFDSYCGEAFYNNKLDDIVNRFKKFSRIDNKALIIPFEDMTPIIMVKSDGASTYHTRDLAALDYRVKKYRPVKILYVVGNPQKLHFEQLFRAFRLINKNSELVHVNFGHFKFKDEKMSTRKGNIIFLEEVLDKAKEYALKLIQEKNPDLKGKLRVAREVGIGAIIFGDLVNDRTKDIVFDWDKVLDFNGDSGPYVQYGYVRSCSILEKSGKLATKIDFELLNEELEVSLGKLLEQFPEIVKKAGDEYKPSLIARYLIDLVKLFNNYYEKHKILVDDKDLRNSRLALVKCVNIVTKNCLFLLGLQAPKKM